LQSRYDGLVAAHQEQAVKFAALEGAEATQKKMQKEIEKLRKLTEEASSVKAQLTLTEEKLRLQIKQTKKLEDEFDNFVKYYEDDGTMVIENLDDTSAINQKIDELLVVVRRAQGPGSSGDGEAHCFLCAAVFSATKWRHECQMCKETFCWDCCHVRSNQLPGTTHKLCVTCVAAVLAIERAKRMRKKLPKEKELANARVHEKQKMTELTQVRKEGKLADTKVVYIVSTEWLETWKKFITGGPRPGPINNRNLIREDGAARQGLEAVKDYRGLSSREWSAFYDWYGGGPPIRREKNDIYSAAIKPQLEQLLSSERTKHARAIKQKGDAPKRSDGSEKKSEEEILAAMATIGNLPMYGQITDGRINRLHGFDEKSFARLQRETKATEETKEAHTENEIPRPSTEQKISEEHEEQHEEQHEQHEEPGKETPTYGVRLTSPSRVEEDEASGGGIGSLGSINS